LRPTGNIRIAPPSQQTGRPAATPAARPGEQKPAAQQAGGARKLGNLTPEMIAAFQGRETPPSMREIEALRQQPQQPRTGGAPRRGGAGGAAPGAAGARGRGQAGRACPKRATPPKARRDREPKRKGPGEGPKSGGVPPPSLPECR